MKFVGWLRRHTTAVVVGAGFLVVIAIGAGVIVTLQRNHNEDVKREKAKAAAIAKAKKDAAAAKGEREAKRADEESLERSLRRQLAKGLREEVTKDANENIDKGVLDGPAVSRTSCDPVEADPISDLSVTNARYDCMAINKTNADGSAEGWRYSGSINFRAGSYRWRLGGGGL
jgi:hypothetical protein